MLGTGYAFHAENIPIEPDPDNTGVENKSMRKQLLMIAAFGAAYSVPCSAAEENVAENADSVTTLANLEIVATRATSKTPVAFSSVKKSEIEKINDGRDLPFLLSMTPSMVSTSDAGAGVGYSTMRIRGTDGTRINVTANGVPINDSESHVVYWVNMPDLASSLKDIQVQRGAGTSTNGAGAFGASVNMMTDSPSLVPYGELSAAYGSYNTHKETLKAGSGLIRDHWTADIRLSNIGSDGYIDRASSSLWSYFGQLGYRNENLYLRLLAFGGKETTYMAWDYASKEDMKKYGRRYNPCGEYTDSEGKTAYYPDQKDYFTQHHFQLLYGQRLGESWRINAALHYTKGDGHYEQLKTRRSLVEYGLTPFLDNDGNLVKKSDLVRLKYNDNDFYGVTASATYDRDRLSLTVGGAANNFHGGHFGRIAWVRNYLGAINPLQKYYDNTGKKFDSDIYARANVDIWRGLSGFADLQYRHINYSIKGQTDNYDYAQGALRMIDVTRKYDFFNPKIGLNFTDGRHNRVFASWSVAHREPVRDNFVDGDPGRYPTAERMFDYELGYVFTSGMFNAWENLYYMDYKDQLVLTGELSDTGNPLSVNVPSSYRMGIELQGGIRPCQWFEWEINATLSRNRIKDYTEFIYDDDGMNPILNKIGSTPIAFSPDFILNNAFSFAWRGFEADLQSHFVSRQYLSNIHSKEESLDPYFVSNLSLAYTVRNFLRLKEVRLGVTVYNIFNEKYENNGYAGAGYYTGDDGKPVIYRYAGFAAQAPANVLASISIRF